MNFLVRAKANWFDRSEEEKLPAPAMPLMMHCEVALGRAWVIASESFFPSLSPGLRDRCEPPLALCRPISLLFNDKRIAGFP